MAIRNETVKAIRERADIVQVIGKRVALQQRGKRFVGLCPFHNENTPSFSVSPDKGLYYCFGCHASGDVFTFVREIEGLDFPSAVREVAREVGMELEPESPEEAEKRKRSKAVAKANEYAHAYFVAQLWSDAGAQARAYLEQRRREGLSDTSVARLLSAIKSFYRWLDRAHGVENAEIAYLRGPKRPRRLPRPVSEVAAKDILTQAEALQDEPWIAARDVAALSLMYGAGLRIGEVLDLPGTSAPAPERLRLTGKGKKTRILPLIPAVRAAGDADGARCPYPLNADTHLFYG